MTFKRAKKLAIELTKLKTDEEKLKYCIEYNKEVTLVLDNDHTDIQINFFPKNEDESIEITDIYSGYGWFDDCLGNTRGVEKLLEFMKIDYMRC